MFVEALTYVSSFFSLKICHSLVKVTFPWYTYYRPYPSLSNAVNVRYLSIIDRKRTIDHRYSLRHSMHSSTFYKYIYVFPAVEYFPDLSAFLMCSFHRCLALCRSQKAISWAWYSLWDPLAEVQLFDLFCLGEIHVQNVFT